MIDLVAKSNLKAKGQAFVVFDDVSSATKAIEEVNGFELFDKPMVLDFAKTRSDKTVLKEEGEGGLEAHKRRRLAEKGESTLPPSPKPLALAPRAPELTISLLLFTERKQAQEALDTQTRLKRPAAPASSLPSQPAAKTARGAGLKPASANASAVIPDEYLPPNKILFLRDIPETYDAEALSAIFSRFEGFKEVRTVAARKGIAFVEYEGEQGAISAKEATSGMQLGEKRIRVTYQRQ